MIDKELNKGIDSNHLSPIDNKINSSENKNKQEKIKNDIIEIIDNNWTKNIDLESISSFLEKIAKLAF